MIWGTRSGDLGRSSSELYLPDWHEGIAPDRCEKLSGAIKQFNAVLEKKIRLTLKARRASLNHPNESVLIPRVHWSSSVLHTSASSTISDIRFTGYVVSYPLVRYLAFLGNLSLLDIIVSGLHSHPAFSPRPKNVQQVVDGPHPHSPCPPP
jgi:hypothetical protein